MVLGGGYPLACYFSWVDHACKETCLTTSLFRYQVLYGCTCAYLNLKIALCAALSLHLAIRLVHGCPFVYSQQRGTVGGITNLADGDPDVDDIELLEIQYWSGHPMGSGVSFRQESGTLGTGIA